MIRDNGGATLSLTIAAFVVALLVGIPLGLLAGRYRDSVADVVIRLFGIVSYAAPIFFVGFLLQVYVAEPLGLPDVRRRRARSRSSRSSPRRTSC